MFRSTAGDHSDQYKFLDPGKLQENAETHVDSLLLCEDQVYDHLKNLNVHKSMGLNEMCLRILSKMPDVVAKPLSMLLERS